MEGNPPPYVAWINVTDGSVLQNRTVNTSYVIPCVSSVHKGTYRCVTGNKYGKDSRETNITYVFGKYNNVRQELQALPVAFTECYYWYFAFVGVLYVT